MQLLKALGGVGLLVTLCLCLPGSACSIDISGDGGDGGDGGGDGGGGDGTPTTITVHLINQTSTTLDPEIYIASEWISVEALFDPSLKFTAYGVGTLGLLAEHGEDTFTLACNTVGMLATQGGKFGDNLNNPTGVGRQIILWQNANFYCGDTITITYSGSGTKFDTNYRVDR
jgi:hypothetical protein